MHHIQYLCSPIQRSHCEFLSERINPWPRTHLLFNLSRRGALRWDVKQSYSITSRTVGTKRAGQFLILGSRYHKIAVWSVCLSHMRRRQVCGIGGQGAVPLSDLQHELYDIVGQVEIAWNMAMGQNPNMSVNTWKWLVAMDVYHTKNIGQPWVLTHPVSFLADLRSSLALRVQIRKMCNLECQG